MAIINPGQPYVYVPPTMSYPIQPVGYAPQQRSPQQPSSGVSISPQQVLSIGNKLLPSNGSSGPLSKLTSYIGGGGSSLPAGATDLGTAMPWLSNSGLATGATDLGTSMPWLSSGAGAAGSSLGSVIPVVGAAASAYGMYSAAMSGHKVGALSGAAQGAASGAAIGSVFPVIGTAIGAVVGGVLGAIGGSLGPKPGVVVSEYAGTLGTDGVLNNKSFGAKRSDVAGGQSVAQGTEDYFKALNTATGINFGDSQIRGGVKNGGGVLSVDKRGVGYNPDAELGGDPMAFSFDPSKQSDFTKALGDTALYLGQQRNLTSDQLQAITDFNQKYVPPAQPTASGTPAQSRFAATAPMIAGKKTTNAESFSDFVTRYNSEQEANKAPE